MNSGTIQQLFNNCLHNLRINISQQIENVRLDLEERIDNTSNTLNRRIMALDLEQRQDVTRLYRHIRQFQQCIMDHFIEESTRITGNWPRIISNNNEPQTSDSIQMAPELHPPHPPHPLQQVFPEVQDFHPESPHPEIDLFGENERDIDFPERLGGIHRINSAYVTNDDFQLVFQQYLGFNLVESVAMTNILMMYAREAVIIRLFQLPQRPNRTAYCWTQFSCDDRIRTSLAIERMMVSRENVRIDRAVKHWMAFCMMKRVFRAFQASRLT
ncbi:uncharacterized protein BX664DRAFT_368074 [Halteromyces radiatus]|uniref:uncharacterized protein n=1 Tax=Halteromyces radiatus TaxID=101107 RepID=UPI00221E55E4|nr:uncharacterized protein BX664DRAFT_368074 [Halteromyces radiatus]KAI8099196.1 hypothetical protein BX664DRAFT_368074 [Halteromyces radiatus]